MSDFDLNLGAIEEDMEESDDETERRVVLGVLDGETPDGEWIDVVGEGDVLVLSIEGCLDDLAAGFAGEIDDAGGSLVHFRDFLVVTPPGVTVDTDRL